MIGCSPPSKKRVGPWQRSSSDCGGLDGARGARTGGVAVVPIRAKALGPTVPQAPCHQRVPGRGTGADPSLGADRASHGGRPDAPDAIGPNRGPLGSSARGRGVCGSTERHACRGARGRAVLPAEVPMDGPGEWTSRLAEDGLAVPPSPGPLPRDLSVSSERGRGVFCHQAAPRAVPPRAERSDATEGGRLADDREKRGPTGPSAGRSGGTMNYGTSLAPRMTFINEALAPAHRKPTVVFVGFTALAVGSGTEQFLLNVIRYAPTQEYRVVVVQTDFLPSRRWSEEYVAESMRAV